MPHATNEAKQLVNGDRTNSQFINHLASYPVVHDSIQTVKENSLGKKSIEIAENAYNTFGKPVEPYLETPYSYAKPYLSKADELADSGLKQVESHFPIVKEDTGKIVDKGKSLVFLPLRAAGEGKDYVLYAWNDEYSKTKKSRNNAGLFTLILALISFQLRLASDFFQRVADFLGAKDNKNASDYYKQAKKSAEDYVDAGQKKLNEYSKKGEKKADELKKEGQEQTEQAKKEAQKAKDEVSAKTNGSK